MFFHLRISLILPAAIVIVAARLVVSFPSHGPQKFLGHSYWKKRYPSLGYTEWDGFWNNYDSGRDGYKRGSSETSVADCAGCDCDDDKQELECRGSPSTL